MTRSTTALSHVPADVLEDLVEDANPPADVHWPAKDFGARMTRGVARVTVEGDTDYYGNPVPRYFYRGLEILDVDGIDRWRVQGGHWWDHFSTLAEARERIDARLANG